MIRERSRIGIVNRTKGVDTSLVSNIILTAPSLPSGLTFSRASAATDVINGVLTSFASGSPRISVANGYLPENQATNYLLWSQDLSAAEWTLFNNGASITPLKNVLPVKSSQNIPDATSGSDTGKGFTITGLCVDTLDNSLWAGNFGKTRAVSGTQGTPQIVHLSSDGSTILGSFDVASYPQGVAVDSIEGKILYTDPANNKVISCNKDGSSKVDLLSVSSLNGLAFDSNLNSIWVTSGTDLVRYNKQGAITRTISTAFAAIDHLFFDASKNWLFVSYGVNNSFGNLSCIDVLSGAIVKTYRFTDAYAVEGISILNGEIIVANDGYYHNDDISDVTRQINKIIRYPFSYGLIPETLPDHIKLGVTGSTGSDNCWVRQSVSLGQERIFSVYIADSLGTGFTVSLRSDDSSGNSNVAINPTGSFARFSLYRNVAGTSQTVMIIARGDYGSSASCNMWVQSAQVEAGPKATSYIPTSGAAATRAADVLYKDMTGIANVSEGTLFVQVRDAEGDSGGLAKFTATLSDGNESSNSALLAISGTNAPNSQVYSGSVKQADISSATYSGGRMKHAVGYAINDVNVAANGVLGTKDTVATMPVSLNRLDIGNRPSGSRALGGYVEAVRYYNKRKTDAELQAMTA